jgi:hypothetical protein
MSVAAGAHRIRSGRGLPSIRTRTAARARPHARGRSYAPKTYTCTRASACARVWVGGWVGGWVCGRACDGTALVEHGARHHLPLPQRPARLPRHVPPVDVRPPVRHHGHPLHPDRQPQPLQLRSRYVPLARQRLRHRLVPRRLLAPRRPAAGEARGLDPGGPRVQGEGLRAVHLEQVRKVPARARRWVRAEGDGPDGPRAGRGERAEWQGRGTERRVENGRVGRSKVGADAAGARAGLPLQGPGPRRLGERRGLVGAERSWERGRGGERGVRKRGKEWRQGRGARNRGGKEGRQVKEARARGKEGRREARNRGARRRAPSSRGKRAPGW